MSTSPTKASSERKSSNGPKLPWWVELLFVQIGLPDVWLPNILRKRNQTNKLIIENKKTIIYLFIIIAGISYIQPFSNYYRRQNDCYLSVYRNLENTGTNINELKIQATNICNGGLNNLQ
tara:strand:- start:49 stop:408 length:360 start_codon:yes stop_codon:yes gene_type:complete